MAVDIEGFDIVFSSANANHAREIDQSIARMSEKVPTLSMGLGEMAKALETLGKLNIDGVKKNLDAVKDSIENIDGSKLNKVFEIATSKSEGLLNSVTSLVNMLGKVDLSSLRGGSKTEIYDERSRVTTTRETGGESQNQEQINALIRHREAEMQRLLDLQNTINQASAKQLDTEDKLRVLRAEHEELTKHKYDIEAKTLAEQKLIEQFEAEKKASEQAKQAFAQAGGEKRLAELKAETEELEKQKALIAQGGSPMSNDVTAALEKEKQLEQDIARFKKEATDQDAKHKELLERIVSLKEKQLSLIHI